MPGKKAVKSAERKSSKSASKTISTTASTTKNTSKTTVSSTEKASAMSCAGVGAGEGEEIVGTTASGTAKCAAKCAVCVQTIIDGKDQAILCEGTCNGWFHRYCAGVPLAHFEFLSSSSICTACFQSSHSEELACLKNDVKFEVLELRAALEAKKDKFDSEKSSYHPPESTQSRGALAVGKRGKAIGGSGKRRVGQGRVQSEANLHSITCVVGEDFSNDGITSQAPTLIKSEKMVVYYSCF